MLHRCGADQSVQPGRRGLLFRRRGVSSQRPWGKRRCISEDLLCRPGKQFIHRQKPFAGRISGVWTSQVDSATQARMVLCRSEVNHQTKSAAARLLSPYPTTLLQLAPGDLSTSGGCMISLRTPRAMFHVTPGPDGSACLWIKQQIRAYIYRSQLQHRTRAWGCRRVGCARARLKGALQDVTRSNGPLLWTTHRVSPRNRGFRHDPGAGKINPINGLGSSVDNSRAVDKGAGTGGRGRLRSALIRAVATGAEASAPQPC